MSTLLSCSSGFILSSLTSVKVLRLGDDSSLQTDQFSSQTLLPQSRAGVCAECGLALSCPPEKEVISLARDAAPKPVLSFSINGTFPSMQITHDVDQSHSLTTLGFELIGSFLEAVIKQTCFFLISKCPTEFLLTFRD